MARAKPSSQTVLPGPPNRNGSLTTSPQRTETQRTWGHREPFRADRGGQRASWPASRELIQDGTHSHDHAPVTDTARPRPISRPGPQSTTCTAIERGVSLRLPDRNPLRNWREKSHAQMGPVRWKEPAAGLDPPKPPIALVAANEVSTFETPPRICDSIQIGPDSSGPSKSPNPALDQRNSDFSAPQVGASTGVGGSS
jgi:hypothetical protein